MDDEFYRIITSVWTFEERCVLRADAMHMAPQDIDTDGGE